MKCIVAVLLVLAAFPSSASIVVKDYLGRDVRLEKPARRIVALAPHIVENIFEAGAGEYLVGAVDYCDYPEQAKSVKRVGAISRYSLEAIVALKPDLVLVWHSGHGGRVLSKLETLGIPVYASDPHNLEDVPRSIRDYGALTGRSAYAEKSASRYEIRHQKLKRAYSTNPTVSTLYQVWNDPIQTLNDKHIISDVIRLCGGQNAFGDSPSLAPKISIESVIMRNPDVIIASGMGEQRPDWLDMWGKWTSLSAVQRNNLFFIPPDIIQRHTVRILEGAQMMCEHLEVARTRK